jgi:hypothetical protein
LGGLCPGNRESGGKHLSGRTRKANRYVKRALCQAAWGASHTKNTYLAASYRRLCVRKGAPKAVMALAHHILTVVYHLLAGHTEYVELGADYFDLRNKPKVVARLVRRLSRLGYYADLKPVDPQAEGSDMLNVNAPPAPALPTDLTSLPRRRKPGRPCKCAERGIPWKHLTPTTVNSLISQPSSN